MNHQLTIRIGAAHDEVVIDGHTFDRSCLKRHQRNAMASLILESLFPGYRPPRHHAPHRPHSQPKRRRSRA